MKSQTKRISVCTREGQNLNGLGMMVLQYLEQNLSEFEDKREAAIRIRGCVAVEVEKGIANTLSFLGDRIVIENGVVGKPDLYLKSSYLMLSKVLSGKVNPYAELLRGNIKMMSLPRRPIQSFRILRFLKIPPELLIDSKPSKGKAGLD